MSRNNGFSGEQRADQRYISGYPLESVVDTLFKRSDAVTHMFLSGIHAANKLNRADQDGLSVDQRKPLEDAVERVDSWIADRDVKLAAAALPDTVPDSLREKPANAPVSPAVGGAVGNAALHEFVHTEAVLI